MLYQRNDTITLGDLNAVCEFSTENSIGFSLRPHDAPGRELGWLDAHVTFDDLRQPKKVYFRLCIEIALSALRRLHSIRHDFYQSIGLPETVLYEMWVFATSKSVLLVDARDCIVGTSFGSLQDDALVLDYASIERVQANEPKR